MNRCGMTSALGGVALEEQRERIHEMDSSATRPSGELMPAATTG